MNTLNRTDTQLLEAEEPLLRTEDLTGMLSAVDELWIFSRQNPTHDNEPLWGVISHFDRNTVHLESCTRDMRSFCISTTLPAGYRFCRRATIFEALTYGWNLGVYEATLNRTK